MNPFLMGICRNRNDAACRTAAVKGRGRTAEHFNLLYIFHRDHRPVYRTVPTGIDRLSIYQDKDIAGCETAKGNPAICYRRQVNPRFLPQCLGYTLVTAVFNFLCRYHRYTGRHFFRGLFNFSRCNDNSFQLINTGRMSRAACQGKQYRQP